MSQNPQFGNIFVANIIGFFQKSLARTLQIYTARFGIQRMNDPRKFFALGLMFTMASAQIAAKTKAEVDVGLDCAAAVGGVNTGDMESQSQDFLKNEKPNPAKETSKENSEKLEIPSSEIKTSEERIEIRTDEASVPNTQKTVEPNSQSMSPSLTEPKPATDFSNPSSPKSTTPANPSGPSIYEMVSAAINSIYHSATSVAVNLAQGLAPQSQGHMNFDFSPSNEKKSSEQINPEAPEERPFLSPDNEWRAEQEKSKARLEKNLLHIPPISMRDLSQLYPERFPALPPNANAPAFINLDSAAHANLPNFQDSLVSPNSAEITSTGALGYTKNESGLTASTTTTKVKIESYDTPFTFAEGKVNVMHSKSSEIPGKNSGDLSQFATNLAKEGMLSFRDSIADRIEQMHLARRMQKLVRTMATTLHLDLAKSNQAREGSPGTSQSSARRVIPVAGDSETRDTGVEIIIRPRNQSTAAANAAKEATQFPRSSQEHSHEVPADRTRVAFRRMSRADEQKARSMGWRITESW